jgi:acetylornithine aminotransferase
MSNQSFIDRHNAALVQNYGKLPAVLVRGEGSRLWDAEGRSFIDLFAGFGGTILGHAHPALVAAVNAQAASLWATGNQFYTGPQIKLAESLKRQAFDGRAFFCHSGAEANEAAIKLARLSAGEGRYKVISMQRGFHGRTLGALSATPTLDYQKGFFPMVPGFSAVPFDDLPALEAAIEPETCAVILEPLQGEGGIYEPSPGFLRGVRELCTRHKLTMIVDEVWTGCARTGKSFCHQHAGIAPDIMTLGKALGGGLPVGCMFAEPGRAALLKPGMHGCTLGGNPICAAAAATVMEVIEKEDLAARATNLGQLALERIRAFAPPAAAKVKEVRGKGLMLGIELAIPDAGTLPAAAMAKGVIVNVTHKHIVRLAPALTISEETLLEGIGLLESAIAAL